MGSGVSSRPKHVAVSKSEDVSITTGTKAIDAHKEHQSPDINEVPSKFLMNVTENVEEDGDKQENNEQENVEDEEEERLMFMNSEDMNLDTEAGEFFANMSLSLGMDNNDHLFNLLYFDEGHSSTFGAVMNSVQQETLALHSSNNTPYKLKPASESAIAGLGSEIFIPTETSERECQVCKDEMEKGCQIIRIPACNHYFHEECLIRWIKLQGWCPVCRAEICLPTSSPNKESKSGKECRDSPQELDVVRQLFMDDSAEGKDSTI